MQQYGRRSLLQYDTAAGDVKHLVPCLLLLQVLQRCLNARQFGLKMIANVSYGYTSASFSGRMPCAELADAIVQVTALLAAGCCVRKQSCINRTDALSNICHSGEECRAGLAISIVQGQPCWGRCMSGVRLWLVNAGSVMADCGFCCS
jgi:hypothetical protein